MSGLLPAVVFAALFYLLLNPSKVKVRMNLMVAWFIFIGALALALLAAINTGFAKWIGAIQDTALAVSIFFMLISLDPGASSGMTTHTQTHTPSTPPVPPQP